MIMNKTLSLIFLTVLLFFLTASSAIAQDDFDCMDCHDALPEKSIHYELDCADCHSDVVDEEHMDTGVRKVACADCHDDISELVKRDIHHRLTHVELDPPDCKTCHGTHDVFPIASYSNITKAFCGDCHDSMVLANPYHTEAVGSETCADCHDTEETVTNLTKSVHGFLNCSDCHNYISNNLEDHPDNFTFSQTADCYICHSDIAAEHRESIHGISIFEGVEEAANCWNCHGSHSIVKVHDTESPVSPKNLPATCATCHEDPVITEKFDFDLASPSTNYEKSVHAEVVGEGGPSCASCHGVHNIKNLVQEGSTIAPLNIPNTCGQCHEEIVEEYKKSIHWIKAQKGVRSAPLCNDCHSEHSINAISTAKNKRHEVKLLQEETCYQCHQNPMIARRSGSEGLEALQYRDSYHGMAVERGDEDAAMCVDCHGVHNILPKKYPSSTVSEQNVTQTCQTCHQGATEVFSKSYSHRTQAEEALYVENMVTQIYFWLIIVVIGGMVIHNIIVYVFEIKRMKKKHEDAITIPRFTKNEVVQHLLLLISFITLAITGFALKYPTSWWSDGLYQLGMTETVRQWIHRISAIIMTITSIYHIFYLLGTKRGREILFEMIPKLRDLTTAVQNVMYHLGLRKEKPLFDKYNYIEKAEYWALIWGTIVMTATGLVLWFPTVVGDWAPIWFIKVAEIVHFYEAILASLAILIWHWFFVIFHPNEYPMSFTWIDGKMDLHHYRHHHENHFRKVLLERMEFKSGEKSWDDLSHSTQLFYNTFKENGFDLDEILQDELNNDEELKSWLQSKMA